MILLALVFHYCMYYSLSPFSFQSHQYLYRKPPGGVDTKGIICKNSIACEETPTPLPQFATKGNR